MQKDIMVLSGYGLDIRVSGGHLKIKDGFPFEQNAKENLINRGTNEVEHLVVIGQTGSISFEAIKWITDQNMMVTMLDPDGNLITNFMPENHVSGIIKRRQATAGENLNLKISSWLLAEKFKEQRNTLNWLFNTLKNMEWLNSEQENRISQAISISYDRELLLSNCTTIDYQRLLEAQSAAAYWHCFEGIPLKWNMANKIPINWLTIGNRTSPKTNSPRKAIEPFNAALNYLYAVLETKTRQTCLINNIDPDFGIIHVDQANRTSLVFDLMEPVRSKVDRILFNWIFNRKLNPKDFFETRAGICRISQDIIFEIVPLIKGLNSDITRVIKDFAGFFKNKMVIEQPEGFQKANKPKSFTKHKKRSELPKQPAFTFNNFDNEKTISPTINDDNHEKKINPTQSSNTEIQCLECGISFVPQKSTQKF